MSAIGTFHFVNMVRADGTSIPACLNKGLKPEFQNAAGRPTAINLKQT